jgi:MinD superfamily P-loop ATPase
MYYPEIDWELCQVCSPCEAKAVCKTRAIAKIDRDEPPYLDPDRCTKCNLCILACPFEAINNGRQGIVRR